MCFLSPLIWSTLESETPGCVCPSSVHEAPQRGQGPAGGHTAGRQWSWGLSPDLIPSTPAVLAEPGWQPPDPRPSGHCPGVSGGGRVTQSREPCSLLPVLRSRRGAWNSLASSLIACRAPDCVLWGDLPGSKVNLEVMAQHGAPLTRPDEAVAEGEGRCDTQTLPLGLEDREFNGGGNG